MATRAMTSDDAAAAAQLVRLVRERPHDRIDPFPPSVEAEVLADAGARGPEEDNHPRVAVDEGVIVGCAALDYSPALKRAVLVGPVVHPAHRRRGFGRSLLADLIAQAKAHGQKAVRACVADPNAAAQTLLEGQRFRQQERHTCLRLERPGRCAQLTVAGISIRRAWADDAPEVHRFLERMVPRTERRTRSLLKTNTYAALLAFQGKTVVAVAEVDMRHGGTATVENLEGKPSLLHKGLANALMAEAVRVAFEREDITGLEFLLAGTDRKRIETFVQAGFQVRDEFLAYERKV